MKIGLMIEQLVDSEQELADELTLVRHVCAVVGRSLTRAEWREYLPDQAYRETCP